MNTSHPCLAVVLAFFPLLTGCAVAFSTGGGETPLPPIEKTVNVNTVSLLDLQEGGMALGGAVIRRGVDLHRYPDLPGPGQRFDHYDQSEFWSSNCEREFAENISNLDLTPFYKFDDFIEDELLASIWNQHAQGGHVDPETLASVKSTRPGVRFLVLFRVEYDDISHNIDPSLTIYRDSRGGLGKAGGGGYDPDQAISSQMPTIKRTVGLSIVVYDLETAQCVWKDGVYDDISRTVDPGTLDDFEGYQARKIEGGQVEVVEENQMADSPEFNLVMDKCLDSLFTKMIREIGSAHGN